MTADTTQTHTDSVPSLDSVKTSIREKAKDTLTSEELAMLKSEICQLSPEAMKQLRAFIDEEYKGILVATRMKLDTLMSECTPVISGNASQKPENSDQNPNEWNDLADVFKGTKSDMMKNAPAIVSSEVMKEIDGWNIPPNSPVSKELLKSQYAENITTAMIAKIASGSIADLAGGFVDHLDTVRTAVNNPNLDTAGEAVGALVWEDKKEAREEWSVLNRVLLLVQNSLKPLRTATEQKPQDPNLQNLLSDPESISKYTGWPIIPTHPTPESSRVFLESMKKNVMTMDSQLVKADAMKDGIFEGMSHLPSDFSGQILGALWDFLKDTWIGKLLAGWLGYSSTESALEGTREEVRRRKSLNMLREYGTKVSDGNSESRIGSKNKSIRLLGDMNLSGLTSKELEDFFDTMKKSDADITAPDFWENIFNTKTLPAKQGEQEGTFSWEFTPSDKLDDIKGKLNKTVWKGKMPESGKSNTPAPMATATQTTPVEAPKTSQVESIAPVAATIPQTSWTGAVASPAKVVPEKTATQPVAAPVAALPIPSKLETSAPQVQSGGEVSRDKPQNSILTAVQKLPVGPINQFVFESNGKPENIVFDYKNQKVQIGERSYAISIPGNPTYISSVQVTDKGDIQFIPRIGSSFLPRISQEVPRKDMPAPLSKEAFAKAITELMTTNAYVYTDKGASVMEIHQA